MSALLLQNKRKVTVHIQEAFLVKLEYVLRRNLEKEYLATNNETIKELFLRLDEKAQQQSLIQECIQVLFASLAPSQAVSQENIIKQNQEGTHDYKDLQCLLQKQEEINRNHIKLEHQMHIYVDSLLEKIHELEKKLASSIANNQLLAQKNRKLQEQLKMPNQIKNNSKTYITKQYFKSKIIQKNQPYFKEKGIMDKIESRAQKMSDKKLQNKIFFKQQQPRPQASSSQIHNQKNRIWLLDRSIIRKHVSQTISKRNSSQSLYSIKEEQKREIKILKNRTQDILNIRRLPKRNSSSQLY